MAYRRCLYAGTVAGAGNPDAISNVMVAEEARGLGVGRQLLMTSIAEAKRLGCTAGLAHIGYRARVTAPMNTSVAVAS